MLVRCPQCRTQIRLTEFSRDERVVRYLCSRCAEIVRIDLILDEVKTSAAASSFGRVRDKRTVLVAEDSKATRQIMAEILDEAGYGVVTAGDGPAAWRALNEHHPDVVVMGLMLRGLTSFELLRRLNSEPRLRRTPVLILSSVYKPSVVKTLSALGAAGFLDKQRLVETLAFRVEAALAEADDVSPRRAAAGGSHGR